MELHLDRDYRVVIHVGGEYTVAAYGCRRVHSAEGTLVFVCPEDSFHCSDPEGPCGSFESDDRFQIVIQVGHEPGRLFAVVVDGCGTTGYTSDVLTFRTANATTAT